VQLPLKVPVALYHKSVLSNPRSAVHQTNVWGPCNFQNSLWYITSVTWAGIAQLVQRLA